MIAINTKYLSPTNTRGARIKATTGDWSATISYSYELHDVALHFEAVKELVIKHSLDWDISKMVYGGTNSGYVFCFPESIIKF
mgnify:CR=1 FL=1